jgi:cytochrome c oxidase subunit 2
VSPQNLFHQEFSLEVAIAGAVFALITAVMLGAILIFRRRSGRGPSETTSHTRAEAVYGIFVAAVAIFLIVRSVQTNGERLDTRPAVTVAVTGYQWCWKFAYPGSSKQVAGVCADGSYPTAVVPAGEVIRFQVTSDDVIHAFWVPYLRFKTYAYPHHVNSFEARIARPGDYPGRCAEFCGLYHSYMAFAIRAVPPAEYSAWLQSGTAPS